MTIGETRAWSTKLARSLELVQRRVRLMAPRPNARDEAVRPCTGASAARSTGEMRHLDETSGGRSGRQSSPGRRSQRQRPAGRAGALVVLVGFAASVAALAAAPALMPAGYSWVSQTTSESAAQGVQGAWLARLGFLLFGLSVILLATLCRDGWGRWAAGLHAGFGVLMTATAAFSHRPFAAGVAFDPTEDLLHSVGATGMGFAFAGGVLATAAVRVRAHARWRTLDAVAVAASVAIPLGMSAWPGIDGLIQRLMFAVSFAWYGVEAVRVIRASAESSPRRTSSRPRPSARATASTPSTGNASPRTVGTTRTPRSSCCRKPPGARVPT